MFNFKSKLIFYLQEIIVSKTDLKNKDYINIKNIDFRIKKTVTNVFQNKFLCNYLFSFLKRQCFLT